MNGFFRLYLAAKQSLTDIGKNTSCDELNRSGGDQERTFHFHSGWKTDEI